jgi:hypothetical protein
MASEQEKRHVLLRAILVVKDGQLDEFLSHTPAMVDYMRYVDFA